MTYKARLNLKFYIVSALMLGLVVFIWYGIYHINANEILVDGEIPMDAQTKTIMVVLLGIIASSWTLSLLTVIRQIITGFAFSMDESGIHTTATAIMVFSLIFVVPVKTIPYDAIVQVSEQCGTLCLKLDKSKLEVFPPLRLFVNKEYRLFAGYTKEKPSEIRGTLNKFLPSN